MLDIGDVSRLNAFDFFGETDRTKLRHGWIAEESTLVNMLILSQRTVMNENHTVRFGMAGIPGKGGVKDRSGPPGNQNAFRHRLAAIEKRQEVGLFGASR